MSQNLKLELLGFEDLKWNFLYKKNKVEKMRLTLRNKEGIITKITIARHEYIYI